MESGTRYVLLMPIKTHFRFITTILVKTFGALCLSSRENAIKVNPPSPLGGRVLGRNLSKALFMSVYCLFAVNSIYENTCKREGGHKPFGQGL